MNSESSAPGKVILFGEHFVVYGIKAILCAINKRIVVRAKTIPEKVISIKSEMGHLSSSPKTTLAEIDSPLKPLFYLAKKLIEKHDYNAGLSVNVMSEIPAGVGLGSSSACCVAGAAAISGLFEKLDRDEILRLAIEAEKTIHQDSSGADCTVCMHGGMMEYSKEGGFARISSTPGFKLVIANSHLEHSTKEIVSNVKRFKERNEAKFLDMCNAENELVENALSLIEKNDLTGLGMCITKNQEMLEAIGISNDDLEYIVRIANKTSFGSKITGAGSGGCIFALNDDSNVQNTICDLEEKNIECFSAEVDFKGLDTF